MMKPTITNAFTHGQAGWRRLRGGPSAAVATLHAALQETNAGWSLVMSPMRVIDALPAWCALGAPGLAGTLICNLRQPGWTQGRQPLHAAQIASRLGLSVTDDFGAAGLALEDEALSALAGMVRTRRLQAARIEGPIEAMDAKAIRSAFDAGRSPLEAELRAVAAIDSSDDRNIKLEVRRLDQALPFVAENLRYYLAAMLDQPATKFCAPPLWQIERLASVSGTLSVRAIETKVCGSFVDIGVGTSAGDEARPAERSLIYDRPSDSWHDEP